MSGAAYAAFIDASNEGKSHVECAAIVCKYCVPVFKDDSIEEIMEGESAETLVELLLAVQRLTGFDEEKNSEAGPVEDLSAA